MKLALIGASGYVGGEFASQICRRSHELVSIGRKTCDLYSVDDLFATLRREAPDAVINCAGYTGKPNVDACENDKANCLAGNAVLPGVIAEACQRLDLPWGHVSSGCIFTGVRPDGRGFAEQDPPNFTFRQNNCSWYSGTKALGEEILADASRCYVWRLRIPFSHIDSPRNYLSKLMRYDTLLEAENSLSNLTEFVTAALDSFEKDIPFGIYNLTNPGSVKTSHVVDLIRESGVCTKPFRFFDSEDEFMKRAAKTPRSNCVLDSSKALAAGLILTPIRDSIRQTLASWVADENQSPSFNGSDNGTRQRLERPGRK